MTLKHRTDRQAHAYSLNIQKLGNDIHLMVSVVPLTIFQMIELFLTVRIYIG